MFNPSLMCMNLIDIKGQTEILNLRCDMYHVDIMDGHFVKNITLSPCFVESFAPIAQKPVDCHLMVTNPNNYTNELARVGAGYICPHAEAINVDAFRTINSIKALGCKVGIVLNPSTPLEIAKYYLHLVDKLTIMSVDPGFAGQPFIREMLIKINEAKEFKEKNGCNYIIEVDGSCNKNTFGDLWSAGTECFIVGTSGLFSLDSDLAKAWDIMMNQFADATKM